MLVLSVLFICTLIQGLHSASTPGILALDLSGDTTKALTGIAVCAVVTTTVRLMRTNLAFYNTVHIYGYMYLTDINDVIILTIFRLKPTVALETHFFI